MKGMQHTQTFVRQWVANGDAGDVAVVIGNRQGETWRFACSDRGDVINGQTLFDMMSVSKIMATTPLFYMAMDEGLVSPEDTLGHYFPSAPADKRDLPLWMLLSHQSGMEHYMFTEYYGPDRRQEAIDFQFGFPLAFKPGTGYYYSCNGFLLLGFLLEKVFNKPLDRLLDDRIVRPLGMKNTMFNPPEDVNIVSSTCTPWQGANKCSDGNNRRLYGVSGNAGVFSCMDDMAIFARSLLNRHRELIRPETFDRGIRDYTPDLPMGRGLGYVYVDARYAQGGGLYTKGTVGHTGYSGTECFADFEQDLFVVSLTNTAKYAVLNKGAHYPASPGVDGCTAACVAFRTGLHKALAKDLYE